MARKRTADKQVAEKLHISERLREIRIELFGDRGGPALAEKLGIPSRSWYNYEIGVTVPAEVLLRVLAVTQVEPHWLLTGEGPKFRPVSNQRDADEVGDTRKNDLSPSEAILSQAVRLLSGGEIRITWKADP